MNHHNNQNIKTIVEKAIAGFWYYLLQWFGLLVVALGHKRRCVANSGPPGYVCCNGYVPFIQQQINNQVSIIKNEKI